MRPLGDVTARSMFGGYGIYCDGVMFGLVADGALYFKVDDHNRDDFVQEGLEPFIYEKKGKKIAMSYYSAPGDSVDNSDALLPWARKGHDAALRARVLKKRKPRKV